MSSSERCAPGWVRLRAVGASVALGVVLSAAVADAQTEGFAVERLYLSPPGSVWIVSDDLNVSGGWGVATTLTSAYAGRPLDVPSGAGTSSLSVVSGEAFIDVGLAVTHGRSRLYLNVPMPVLVAGNSGTIGSLQVIAPAVSLASHPDSVSDPRIGFDVRVWGQPGDALRLGVGAALIIKSGDRADYVTDGTTRAMMRLLAAGDRSGFVYTGQVGLHLRALDIPEFPDGPLGNEWLFGASAGKRLGIGPTWTAMIGPEVFGETAVRDAFGAHTGVEGLVTAVLTRRSDPRGVRFRLGIGGGFDPHFGAARWRLVLGADLIGRQTASGE